MKTITTKAELIEEIEHLKSKGCDLYDIFKYYQDILKEDKQLFIECLEYQKRIGYNFYIVFLNTVKTY